MILNMVDDAKSLESISNSTSFFRQLLAPKRVEFLAPGVLKLLATLKYTPTSGRRNNQMPSLLALRRVCKFWCSGIDEMLEQETCTRLQYNRDSVDIEPHFKYFRYDCVRKTSVFSPYHFILHFQTTHLETANDRNPIIGRYIAVNYREFSYPYYDKMFNLFGKHIWYLQIYHLCSRYPTYEDMFYKILKALPNLKVLVIKGCYASGRPGLSHNGSQLIFPNLEFVVAEEPCPHLYQIIRDNPSIVGLDISSEECPGQNEKVYLPKVKHLKFDFSKKLVNLRNFGFEIPALCTLEIRMPVSQYNGSFSFLQKMFRLIKSNWGSASFLTHVRLELPACATVAKQIKILQDGVTIRLQLEHVEYLFISMGSPFPLDFLLPMKQSLKQLCVKQSSFKVDYFEDANYLKDGLKLAQERQKIQFLGWEHRLLDSNIWDQFPKLKEVVLDGSIWSTHLSKALELLDTNERRCYTRKEWLLAKN